MKLITARITDLTENKRDYHHCMDFVSWNSGVNILLKFD